MKTNLLKSLALTFSISALPMLSYAQEDFKPSSNIVTLMPIVIENLDTLEISKQELNELRNISRDNFAKVEEINALYHDIKSELKEELLDVNNKDNQHSKDLVSQLVKLEQQRMMLTLDCTQRLKQILPAEKYNEVIELLEFRS